MRKLFEITTIKNMKLVNRFVRSATNERMADEDGFCTDRLSDLMVELARGEVGLVITGHAYVHQDGRARSGQLGIHRDELIPRLIQMTRGVHDIDTKIVMQLSHAGCEAFSELTGSEPYGPSPTQNEKGETCREMPQPFIGRIAEDFGRAAIRARKSGFDGVQIHAAHGFLLSQFLSPFFNKREDNYGGSVENRARIVLEVFKSVRSAVGDDFPVLIKLNSEDFLDSGFTVDEMLQVAAMLEAVGIDAIELSGGTRYSGQYMMVRKGRLDNQEDEVYYLNSAKRYKQNISVPLILVGGIRSYEIAARLVREDIADYISLSRPFIREPNLIRRWRARDTRKAACISDNLCTQATREGRELYCVTKRNHTESNVEENFC